MTSVMLSSENVEFDPGEKYNLNICYLRKEIISMFKNVPT